MPFNSGIRDALSIGGNKSAPAVRDAVEREYAWVCPPGFAVSDYTPGLTRVIVFGGRVFQRDDADTTTPHDGVSTLVTQGGVRFKADGFGQGPVIRRYAVLSRISAPPGSPALGDSHLVAAPGTGAFATHVGKIASWTSAGWRFVVPRLYDEAHVAAEALIYHYNASSVWVQGSPAIVIADNSLLFTKLKHGLGLAVENQTTNTPPASPSNGVAYIIGPSPTGVWTGHALKVALFDAGAWLIVAPQIGWKVYDKAIAADAVYDATGWVSLVSGYAKIQHSALANSTSLSVTGTGTITSETSLTTASTNLVQSENYTAKKTGSLVEVLFSCKSADFSGNSGSQGTIILNLGLFIDGGANSVTVARGPGCAFTTSVTNLSQGFDATMQWVAPDSLSHSLSVRASIQHSGTSSRSVSLRWTRLIIRELA